MNRIDSRANEKTSDAQAPPVRTFQDESGTIGDITQRVNLFRGSATYALDILSLPGPAGLEVQLRASYSSSLRGAAATWNVEAPTGPLGLGWTFGLDAIVVNEHDTGSMLDNDYFLVLGGQAIPLIRTGSSGGRIQFEAFAYQFWRIEYEPGRERWELTAEDARTLVFGDTGSGRETVQWGVRWGNWIGSSSLEEGQQRYAVAWNLSETVNVWGTTVTYAYTPVQQRVSPKGLFYTKETYLTRIVDAYGRVVTLRYDDKTWDEARKIFEYQDPHKPVPNTQPDGYQDRYSTKYLSEVQLAGSEGQFLMRISFAYKLLNFGNASDPAHPWLYKRVLTSVTQQSGGDVLPGVKFDYVESASDPNPGALAVITYPDGGTVRYDYSSLALPDLSKEHQVASPFADGVPRVWHGPDYLVLTWYSKQLLRLRLSVWRWDGRWREWTASGGIFDRLSSEIDVDSMDFAPGDGAFAFSFVDAAHTKTTVALFHRDVGPAATPADAGKWLFETKSISMNAKARPPQLAAGSDFIVLLSPDFKGDPLRIYSWTWQKQAWEESSVPRGYGRYSRITAGRNFYLTANYDPAGGGTVQYVLRYRDADGVWRDGSSWRDNYHVAIDEDAFPLVLTAGSVFAAVTYVAAVNPNGIQSAVRIVQWSSLFQVVSPSSPLKADVTSLRSDIEQALVANAGKLFRFIGGVEGQTQVWVPSDLRISGDAEAPVTYATGNDLGVVADARGTIVQNRGRQYDPRFPNEQGWSNVMDFGSHGVSPTLADDYLTFGGALFRRHFNGTWEQVKDFFPSNPDAATIINRAPRYIAYEQDRHDATTVVTIRNGQRREARELRQQRSIVDGTPRPGTILGGGDSLVTYPVGRPFDQAQSLTLYRIVEGSVAARFEALAVRRVTVNDGYEQFPVDLTYTTAAFSGGGFEFGRAASVTGTVAEAGSTVWSFSNGLFTPAGPSYPAGWVYNGLPLAEGLLLYKEERDDAGRSVSSLTNFWSVFRKARSAPGGTPRQLAGGWVRNVKQIETLDGVAHTIESVFDDFCGLVTETKSSYFGSEGKKIPTAQKTIYAWQVPEYQKELVAAHLLAGVARVEDVANGNAVAIRVTTWKRWTERGRAWGPSGDYRWKGTGSSTFDYRNWSGPNPPDGNWVTSSRIHAVLEQTGQAVDQSDVNGVHSSVVYDTRGLTAVATVLDASVVAEEFSYYSFETYETAQGWRTVANGQPVEPAFSTDYPFVGRRSLRLAAGGNPQSGLTRTFRMRGKAGRPFSISCRVRTAPTYTASSAGWRITVRAGSNEPVTVSRPFSGTAGEWAYFTAPFDVPAGTDVSVELLAFNGGSADVFLDTVCFAPRVNSLDARSYETGYWLPVAKLGTRGEVSRSEYDDDLRLVATTGPEENLNTVTSWFLSRQAGGSFDPALPNGALQVSVRGAGFLDTFRSGKWETRWSSPTPAAWQVIGDSVVHSGSGAATLSLREPASGDFGASAHVVPPGTLTAPVSMSIGTTTVRYDPAGSKWELLMNGSVVSQATGIPLRAGDWILVVSRQTVLFFYEGQQLFQARAAAPLAGVLSFGCTDRIAYERMAVFHEPELSIEFRGGAALIRQRQLFDGESWVASGTLYDRRGKATVQTKPAPRPRGTTGPTPFGYWPGLVTSFNPATGVMHGAVSDYYSANGGGFSNDQNFPYKRDLPERAPTARTIEQGDAGRDLAITGSPQDHTTRISYTRYGGSFPLPGGGTYRKLPAGEYRVVNVTNPDGITSFRVVDVADRVIAQSLPFNAAGKQLFVAIYHYDDANRVRTVELPNAFAPPPGSSAANWIVALDYDFLGRPTRRRTPDAGETRLLFDLTGKLRFSQTPELKAAGRIAYAKYDALERVVEQGVYAFAWTGAEEVFLRDKAENDRNWPPTPATWEKQFVYDVDPQQPEAPLSIGRLTVVRSKNVDDADVQTTERMRYALNEQVVAKDLLASAYDDRWRTIDYAYDNKTNPRLVSYNDAQSTAVFYRYAPSGLLESIGSSAAEPDTYARLQYNADGSVAAQVLDPQGAATRRTFSYNSPGWPTGSADNFFAEALRYFPKDDAKGYFDGQIAEQKSIARWKPGAPALTYSFTYDEANRLTASQVAEKPALTEAFVYDANGNITRVAEAGAAKDVTFEPGTDRATAVGSGTQQYVYDGDGRVKKAVPRSIESLAYEPTTGKPVSIRMSGSGGATLGFSYGADARVVKDTTTGATGTKLLYVHGLNAQPLVERLSEKVSGAAVESAFIYGAGGLLAMRRGGMLFFVERDHLGSTRAVVRGGSAPEVIAAYDYQPFGAFAAAELQRETIRYLFTGQELDFETGLYNFRARLYDPDLRAFYSPDTAMQFASPYIYGGNDPVALIDPTGNEAITIIVALIIGAIVGAIVGAITSTIIAVTSNFDAGKAAWFITVSILLGAAMGALVAAVPEIATAGIAAYISSTAAKTAAELVIGTAVRVGIGSAVGSAQGAFNSAVTTQQPGAGAAFGAITGAVSGAISGGVRGVLRALPVPAAAPPAAEGVQRTIGTAIRAGIRNTARAVATPLQSNAGAIGSGLGGGASGAVGARLTDGDARAYIQGILLGASSGFIRSASIRYVSNQLDFSKLAANIDFSGAF